jgi:hypothetical protein
MRYRHLKIRSSDNPVNPVEVPQNSFKSVKKSKYNLAISAHVEDCNFSAR